MIFVVDSFKEQRVLTPDQKLARKIVDDEWEFENRYETGKFREFNDEDLFHFPIKRTGDCSMKAAQEPLLQFFAYQHLKPDLQAVSQYFSDLAYKIVETLPRNSERTVALRKLLESKDCAVRSYIFKFSDDAPQPVQEQIEDIGGDGGAMSQNAASSEVAEAQKKRGDDPRDDEPETFHPGSMVALNNPNPPLRIEIDGRQQHSIIKQGEIGQMLRMDEEGMAVVVWRSLPSLRVMVPVDWLVAAIETGDAISPNGNAAVEQASAGDLSEATDEVFPQPHAKQTPAAYSEYAKKWLARAIVKKLPAEDVQSRWEKERKIRADLASPFQLEDWTKIRQEFTNTMAKLQAT